MAKTKALTSLLALTVMPNHYSPSMRSSAYTNTWTQVLSNGILLFRCCCWNFFYFGTWFIDFLVNVFQDDFYVTSKRWATVISSNNKSKHTSSMYINIWPCIHNWIGRLREDQRVTFTLVYTVISTILAPDQYFSYMWCSVICGRFNVMLYLVLLLRKRTVTVNFLSVSHSHSLNILIFLFSYTLCL